MTPTFDIAVEWASETAGRRSVPVRGVTVGECLDALLAAYPGLLDRMQLGRHELYVNWQSIRHTGGLMTPVGDGDVIQLLPGRS